MEKKKSFGAVKMLLLGLLCLLLGALAAAGVMFSTLKKADAAFARGEIAEAKALAEKAGNFGTERLLHYRRGEAALYVQQGNYAAAAALCEELGDEGGETWSAAMEGLTREALAAGSAEEALDLLERWTAGDASADTGLYAWETSRLGLRQGDYALTRRALERCGERENAPVEREFMDTVEAGYYERALALLEQKPFGEEQNLWEAYWEQRRSEERKDAADARLQAMAVRRGLGEEPCPGESDSLLWKRGYGAAALLESRGSGMTLWENDQNNCVVDFASLSDVCRGTRPGSLLVLCRQQVYHSGDGEAETRTVLALDFQRKVDEARCPHMLEEAEYLLILSYSYENDGWYSNNTVEGVRESVTVRVLNCAGEELWSSPVLKGPAAPETFSYYELPEFVSGGAPESGEVALQVRAALLSVFGEDYT